LFLEIFSRWELKSGEKSIDLGGRKLIAMRDVQDAVTAGATSIAVAANSVVTPSARDFLQQHGIELVTEKAAGGSQQAAQPAALASAGPAAVNRRLFSSPEAEAIKKEICAVGRKLWMRQFVDGNGGNISYRMGPNEVLCSPTLVSKYDLTPDDIGMTDLGGVQIAGLKQRTSELLLHLEIYKANAQARAVVHCHPPYATAFAMTGTAPPNGLISEYEMFVGPVAVAPYETPGTQAFAETVIPFVEEHNTILLTNHGVVCWSDTATHAEWLVEIVETYCKKYLIAKQIGEPLKFIPDSKIEEILAFKRRLGYPDARLGRPAQASGGVEGKHTPELEHRMKQAVAHLAGRQ
jgi:L-fuculose-phosphate aldolase